MARDRSTKVLASSSLPPPPHRPTETSTHTPTLPHSAAPVSRAPWGWGRRAIGAAVDFDVWVVSTSAMQTAIFRDIARSLAESLRQLGYSVEESYGPTPSYRGRQVIALGTNMLRDHGQIPPDAIIYQLEHARALSSNAYLHTLKTHIVWDFSAHSAQELRRRGCPRVHVCRAGHSPFPAVNRPSRDKNIDVIFYGLQNARRKPILDCLRAKRVNVHSGDIWGEARADAISRSKVVLNLHSYDNSVLEMVRIAPALEQGAFVVSETGADREIEKIFDGGIIYASHRDLVDTITTWLAKPQSERDAVADRGKEILKALPHKGEVARCISESLPNFKPNRIKCYINNRDRLTWTRSIAREIERLGGEPIIVDNASTYPPLLAWYADCPYRVIRLPQNTGSRAPWIAGVIDREVRGGEKYVVTDPDLDLSGVPGDALQMLAHGLDKYGRRKAGLSLEINDVPRHMLDVMQVNNRTLEQCEAGYWQRRLDANFYDAAVDTTFAMYQHGKPVSMDGTFCSGVRADRPYTAKHLPWYRVPKDFDEEDRYYVAHRAQTSVAGVSLNGTWYDAVQRAIPGR